MSSTLEWASSAEAGSNEGCVAQIVFGEYLSQLVGGLPMSQNEMARPADLGIQSAAAELASDTAVADLMVNGNTPESRAALAEHMVNGGSLAEGLGDDTLDMIRGEMRRFSDARIKPDAHQWHLADSLIPDDVVGEMAELGVFGVCINPDHGGHGLGKLAMCVVSEELSRGWIGAGSLGTRSEIAGELIARTGTAAQKDQWLPGIADGTILPTAVFTEPETGSDLGSLRTRATKNGGGNGRSTATKPDHARFTQRLDDRAGPDKPDKPGYAGLYAARAQNARHRRQPVSGRGHQRRRNPGARLSRYERVRTRFRPL